MRNRTFLSTLTAFVLAAFIVDAAQATTKTWNGSIDSNWNTAGNWSPSGVPTASDDAVLPALSGAYTVTVDGAPSRAQTVDVHANCTISIGSGKRLELGSADGQTSNIDGVISLPFSTSVLRLMFDHVVQPKTSGATVTVISSGHASALIDDDSTNPSKLTLQRNGSSGYPTIGCMTLDFDSLELGTGVPFTMSTTCITLGNSFSAFRIAGGTLTFASAYTGLSLNFFLSAGTLDLNENVCTSGNLSFSGGTIDVAASKSFKASGSCP